MTRMQNDPLWDIPPGQLHGEPVDGERTNLVIALVVLALPTWLFGFLVGAVVTSFFRG